jgi:shikimate dehydrogenase
VSDQYAVIGNPVAHSKSPFIHASFARQTAQDLDYTRILAQPGEFTQRVRDFFRDGGKGLNVTVPFKQEAFALAASLSPQASLAGAVNTLMLDREGQLYGHNTDGIGLVRDITRNFAESLHGKRLLVLGAGGATRGILQPLLEQGPASLFIANRTAGKARELAAIFSNLGPVQGGGFDEVADTGFDWILNATAASLQGELPPLPDAVVAPTTACYDLMYGAVPTIFCKWALTLGARRAIDGLGMLVEQAAEAFLLWRGLRPDTAQVLQDLRNQLAT